MSLDDLGKLAKAVLAGERAPDDLAQELDPARVLAAIALLREAKKAVVSLKGLLECDEFREDEQDGIAHCAEWLDNLTAFEELP